MGSTQEKDVPLDHGTKAKGSRVNLNADTKTTKPIKPRSNRLRNGSGSSLMRLMDSRDWLVMIISGIASIIAGGLTPLTTVLVGNMARNSQAYFRATGDSSELSAQITKNCLYYVYLAIAEFVFIYIATVGFMTGGERITQKVRESYLAAVLSKEVAFFDELGSGEITNRISGDINLLQEGLTGKLALSLTALATFGTAFVISLVEGWRLGLVMLSAIVAIVGCMTLGGIFVVKYTKQTLKVHGLASSVAQEAASAMKQVTAMGIQERLLKQYDDLALRASRTGIRSRCALALMIAIMNALIFWAYGLAFWQGSRFLVQGEETVGAVVTTLLAVIVGAFSLGNVSPHLQAFGTSIASAHKIFETIEQQSTLDHASHEGLVLPEVAGDVEFHGISHSYPSRPDARVLDNVSFRVQAGKTTAFVGPSGSGKSTVISLLERFYDPLAGNITLDGYRTSSLNLRWLRQQMSLVGQEPVLFGTTIYENIAFGLDKDLRATLTPSVLLERVMNAAEEANAMEFIQKLPEGLYTDVGEQGRLLSGGQKQRIAIARAIIKKPRLLLLDEATSALDVNAEGEVQKAINRTSAGRTTIVVAHRLSTIASADQIVVLDKGAVAECGTHAELMQLRGLYASMVEKQKMSSPTTETKEASARSSIDTDQVNTEKESISSDTETLDLDMLKDNNTSKVKGHSIGSLLRFVAHLNRYEWPLLITGLVFAILTGLLMPTQSVFFAKLIQTLSIDATEFQLLRSQTDFWCSMYLMLGCVSLTCWLVQGLCFSFSAERLVIRAKHETFRAILYQDISLFERAEMTSGSVAGLLSTSVNGLAGLSGVTLGTILVVASNLIGGICLSVAFGWKLALVCVTTIPIILLCGWTRLKMLAILERQSKGAYEQSATYACEAASAMRTVASLTLERQISSKYHDILEKQRRHSAKSVVRSSLLYAATQSINFLCAALAFWYGGRLIVTDGYSQFTYFVCYSAIIAGAYSAGAVFSFAPDMGKARQAATDIKTMVDRVPLIDARKTDGDDLLTCDGNVSLNDVSFSYPSRPQHKALRNANIKIQHGQYVAFCGASGSGKSTIVSLLERFYDPTAGTVAIDGHDIKTLNVQQYRRHLSLVSQEPVLFDGTVRSNIAAGLPWQEASDEQIEKACRDAHILDFILSLPNGFNTEVGSKGVMLSGGQRQRLAIARALIRDPRILILDEATSALDTESERAVQKAIEAAAAGRTTIAVAHRLSTIQRADCIFVLSDGEIVEQGTHRELMELQGRYYGMVRLQSLDE